MYLLLLLLLSYIYIYIYYICTSEAAAVQMLLGCIMTRPAITINRIAIITAINRTAITTINRIVITTITRIDYYSSERPPPRMYMCSKHIYI